MKNPWLKKAPEYWGDMWIQAITVDDRLKELKEFGINKLKQVIRYPGTQKTVRKAAERRLKALKKKAET